MKVIYTILITAASITVCLVLLGLILWIIKCKKPCTNSCPPCTCPQPKNREPFLAAYYTFYQDPNCSGDCKPTPCTKSILSDPTILNSKLNLVIINPIAPATSGGVTLSFINNIYTGQVSDSNTYYDPPPAIKKGISDLHAHGKKVTLSFIPGSAKDKWGQGDKWFQDFTKSCQNIMTTWDIDGFDWDCEADGCPPAICGGDWTKKECQMLALNIFKSLKSLKPNTGRGNNDGTPVVTWTGELSWQMESLQDASPYLPYVDYFMTMNENYSVIDPSTLYKHMQEFSKKGWPMSQIVNGVKVGGCFPGTNGDGANIEQVSKLMTTPVDGQKTLSDIGAGWVIWNLSRDYGCTNGRTTTYATNNDDTSKFCYTCKDSSCPKGYGGYSAGPQFSFLKKVQLLLDQKKS